MKWKLHNTSFRRKRSTHPHIGFLPLISLLIVASACNKKEEVSPVVPPTPPPPVDTNWVTKPQVDIPWPGLLDGSPWPMHLHDPQHTGRSPYLGPQEGKVEWLFDAGQNVYSSPVIDGDGTVYFGSMNEYFYAVTPTGTMRWRSHGGGSDNSPVIANDGRIYSNGPGVGGGYNALLSYDQNGKLNWEDTLGGSVRYSSPTIAKDGKMVFLVSKEIHAVRKDGTLHWKFLPDNAYICQYSIAMSPDGTTLYVPGWRALYAIDTSGSLKWQFAVATPSSPAVDNDGNIYFATPLAQLYSLDPSGIVRWTRDNVFSSADEAGPAIGRDGTIYVVGDFLYAFDYVGKPKWSYPIPGRTSCTPAIDSDGTLYLGTCTNRGPADSINFLAINPNGKIRFQMSLRSPDGTVPDIDSKPAISSDGRIFVGSDRPHGIHLYKIK